MAKKLIICFDGTWNNKAQEDSGIAAPTNVVKIYRALDHSEQSNQLRYYHPGVGAEGGWFLRRLYEGATGSPIKRHICSAYYWLGMNYEPGDEIYLFGFSRGAFTVRCVAGFLGMGLLNLKNLETDEAWERVHSAYNNGYKKRKTQSNKLLSYNWAKSRGKDWDFITLNHEKSVPVKFLGVWDTVGALGVPNDLEIFNFIFDDKKDWQFHDTSLGKNVENARHAMAMDEERANFTVTKWDNTNETDNNTRIKQIWFPGVHSDVGGGYADHALSDIALEWMIQEAQICGLKFRNSATSSLKPDPMGIMHNSYKGAFSKLRSRPRNVDKVCAQEKGHLFHPAVFARQNTPPLRHPEFWPIVTLKPQQTFTIDIFAKQKWNKTGIYLEEGKEYIFSASGKWQDGDDTCDWRGTQNNKFTIRDVFRFVASVAGNLLEKPLSLLYNNKSTDLQFTKRVETINWFSMVGAIANDSICSKQAVDQDGSPTPHQYINLPEFTRTPFKVQKPGYLYCFPNDAWGYYSNNKGAIKLTIKCC